MKLRSPWLVQLIGFILAFCIRLWVGTLRYRVVSLDGGEHPADYRRVRFIYALWHESILFPTNFRSRIHVLVSQHADGELVNAVSRQLGYRVVRGSTNRGGSRALLQLCRASHDSHLLLVPDGPRGPRRRVQLGLIYLASRTGLPVVGVGVGYQRCWRARSWDRFAMPRPWSLAVGVVAPPIAVPPDLDRHGLELYRRQVEAALSAATEAAERMAQGQSRRAALEAFAAPPPLRASA
jgi:lysophospholipid acyltransferase (LPLAT)-like uncharacterized protein